MAKLFGLDIPDGLEQLFAKVLQLKPNGEVSGVGLTLPQQNFTKARKTAGRSLIVLWQPLFDGFDLDRRNAWHAYWGGWPGSGFSAFIEVNAPLYKAGLDLLLDPPSANLIPNPTFLTALNWWDFEDTADWEDHDGFARCLGGSNGLFSGSLSSPEGSYRLEFDVSNSNGGNITIYDPSSFVFQVDSPLLDGHFNNTRLVHNPVSQLVFEQSTFTGDITNVVLTKIG